MVEPFHSRIPTLSDGELREYVRNPLAYKVEAVEAALAELSRRGSALPREDVQRIREDLMRRDRAKVDEGRRWSRHLLGADEAARRPRIRSITSAILVLGLGSAAIIHQTASPKAPNPLGYEPEDTKRYLRQLETVGGKSNVLATQFTQWFDSLWHGQALGFTVACLTVALAATFWFVTSHARPDKEHSTQKPHPSGDTEP